MVRVYHEQPGHDGTAPRTFGPLARFDPHVRDARQRSREDPQGRGVLYLAADLATALAESYPEQWPEVSICLHTRAAWVCPPVQVALLDLSGEGALAIGATGVLQWGDEPRRRTQRWGRRIYEQYGHLEGIRYQAANQGECTVLWERAPTLQHLQGGDRSLWAVWSRVVTALAGQRRTPRRIEAGECRRCREAGLANPTGTESQRDPGSGRP
jgi:RES domain